MQKPMHQYRNVSRVFTMLESLYAYVSDEEGIFDEILWLDNSFKDLVEILAANLFKFRVPLLKDFNLPKIEYERKGQKDVIVCISGGKDSAAVAKYYTNLGYSVHLYYAEQVNKSYPDEKQAAQRVAEYLGCDLHIEKTPLVGTHHFVEHPMKNITIANGALHYAIANGYDPCIAFGNFSLSYTEDNPFEVCGGDCIDMWRAYEKIIRNVLPDFHLWVPLKTNADSYALLKDDAELFGRAVSCILPYRWRATRKHEAEQKYGVRLLDNRCGVCWKCCMEAMWLMDNDLMAYNEAFYLHCFEVLSRTIVKETDWACDDPRDVWNNYMFYPICDSKAKDRLMKARFKPNGHYKFI